MAQLIERFGLSGHLGEKPYQLSGGLAQRVAMARAVAARPRLLLLDEPLSALDWPTRRQLQDVLVALHRDLHIPVVLVTHQLAEAQRMAHRIGVLDEGELLQMGSVDEVVTRPATPRVAALVGYTAFLPIEGRVVAVHPERVVLGARPHLGPVLTGVVERMTWLEGRRVMDVRLAQGGGLSTFPCTHWIR
ncbi:hypothetical protein GCM10025857_12950 [Alicyclobacillus contaminans]|nr:hypothetical protein GCM10025857_12950 [Alicyclobacillus contaminans]